ncbi:MAG: PDZ domain-containing protein, partial [Gemmatimonadetes bacterium]
MTMFDPLRTKAKVVIYTTLAFLFGVGLASGMGWTEAGHAMPALQTTAQIPEDAVQPALQLSAAFERVAEVVTPAVVRIEAERHASPQRGVTGAGPFRFFRDPDPEPRLQLAGGSGFLVSKDGYILTNNHVVADAERIRVYLVDRRVFDAELVGRDPFTDVAVIKISDGDNEFPFLSFGSSDEVRVGEWIVAVGNPGFGGGSTLDYTVTAGIISAKGRPLQLLQTEILNDPDYDPTLGGYAVEDFLQTDAVINPGNSGGPMVDLRGRVVGINSAIASRTGFYQGYGFAIPIDLARHVMEDLIEYGHVRRALMGISLGAIDAVKAEAYGLPSVSGVEVQDVTRGGPADRAGIEPYDVIVSIDGVEVATQSGLQQLIARRNPGDRVKVRLYRDGKPREIEVELGEADLSPAPTRTAAEPTRPTRVDEKLGLRMEDMTRDIAAELGYDEAEGVVITDVAPDGPAAEIARSLPLEGARVVEINRQP